MGSRLPAVSEQAEGRRPESSERAGATARGDAPDTTPLAAALDSVGDRWTLLLVEALLDAPRRFGDLQDALPGIAPNVLTQRLRRLAGEGLVLAQPYSERPRRFVYELTAAGHELAGALRLLADWGARHREGGEPPRHDVCGTPVEARLWCPTCERPVGDDETAHLHYA
jgi:DNA-binding HxlR family transcriptional regulator